MKKKIEINLCICCNDGPCFRSYYDETKECAKNASVFDEKKIGWSKIIVEESELPLCRGDETCMELIDQEHKNWGLCKMHYRLLTEGKCLSCCEELDMQQEKCQCGTFIEDWQR